MNKLVLWDLFGGGQNSIYHTVKEYNLPIVCNMDFGHVFPIMTLPIGREAIIECKKGTINFELMER